MTAYRWSPNRKAAVVQQVAQGHLTRAAAIGLYQLSDEELAAWERDYRERGIAGLSVTKPKSRRKLC